MGVNVSATNDEIITAPETTILNSRKSLPVIPSKNTMGMKTATNVTVVETTAKNISFDPSIAASRGIIPFSIFW